MAPDALPPPDRASACRRWRILARGAVQGVGFRPFVHRTATALGLSGWVRNTADGIAVEAEGEACRVDALIQAIREAPPVNASVAAIDVQEVAPCGETAFRIRASEAASTPTAQILPDLATCADCIAELLDPANRRHLYPFINCTQCGPRYSIVEAIPYDRARTSMRHFAMCPDCRHEYEDPADRRFHAEPNACPVCGPRLALWDEAGAVLARDHPALLAAAEALRQGRIVAVKGIGGFHLLTDARNEAAIRRLRARKRRAEKPFAVMFSSLAAVMESCRVAAAEGALLVTPARPIVLLRRMGGPVAAAAAPGSPWLGALLPYAPLHHLLLRVLAFPVVATSGNISEEPIVTDEQAALDRLAGIADAFLVHDRPIVRALDDSVARVVCGRELLLRRARGYAPSPIAAAVPPGILALGGHLKTAVALTAPGSIVLSPHIGDLDTVAGRAAHGRVVADMVRLHAIRPRLVARDLHPDYASSHSAAEFHGAVVAIPHHLAHVAACMAEHGLTPPALGVAWDGAGYGPDGTIWGGEFLLVGKAGWRRVAHLRPFSLPGGEAAAREPRRAALGLLFEAFGEAAFAMTDLPPVAAFTAAERGVLLAMLTRRVNAPRTTSAGRLFDGFAALCGLRQHASYEGQAAAEFEGAAGRRAGAGRSVFPVRKMAAQDGVHIVDWQPALERALAELRSGGRPGAVAAAVHDGLAAAIAAVAARIGERRVLLTGGCFQNARLTAAAVAALRSAGCVPEWHRRVPPNDGGLALGQAAWAAWNESWGATPCA